MGRKRHVAVDSDERLLAAAATRADVQDQDDGIALVKRLVRLCPWIAMVVADGGDKTRFIEAARAMGNRMVEVVEQLDSSKGFVLLPKR